MNHFLWFSDVRIADRLYVIVFSIKQRSWRFANKTLLHKAWDKFSNELLCVLKCIHEKAELLFILTGLSWWRVRKIFVLVMGFVIFPRPQHSIDGFSVINAGFLSSWVVIYCILETIMKALCMMRVEKVSGFLTFYTVLFLRNSTTPH